MRIDSFGSIFNDTHPTSVNDSGRAFRQLLQWSGGLAWFAMMWMGCGGATGGGMELSDGGTAVGGSGAGPANSDSPTGGGGGVVDDDVINFPCSLGDCAQIGERALPLPKPTCPAVEPTQVAHVMRLGWL